jgi:hypothetical protein
MVFIADGEQVNIPAPLPEVDGVRTPTGRGSACQNRLSRKGEGIYDPEVLGRSVKKSRRRTKEVTVLKPGAGASNTSLIGG